MQVSVEIRSGMRNDRLGQAGAITGNGHLGGGVAQFNGTASSPGTVALSIYFWDL